MIVDQRVPDPKSQDPDTPLLIEALRGASRGARDPDFELAEMLSELDGTADRAALTRALERLVLDANTH